MPPAIKKQIPANRNGLNRDFWKYWTGQTISNLGSSITLFALPLLVYKLTGSALSLGITSAVETLPYLLFGLLLGAWMDRVDRKRMMIATDLARILVIALIPLVAVLGLLSVWWIYGIAFIHATLTFCFDAGEFAAIPSLVKQDNLVTANGRIQASYSAAKFAGPMLAGVLVFTMPLTTVMLFDALSFLFSAISLALIKISFNSPEISGEQRVQTSMYHDMLEGLRYVLKHPILRNLSIMMVLVNFVSATTFAQLVLFAKQQLLANDFQVSLLYSIGSAGIVVISLSAGLLRKRWSFSTVALNALMLGGLLTTIMALLHDYWIALILWGLIMGMSMLFNINTSSLRQTIVPNQMLGRVISIARMLATSAVPLGSFIGGLAITWTNNVALIYGICGVLTFLIPIIFLFTPLVRAEEYMPQKALKL
jgi:MFS family permease